MLHLDQGEVIKAGVQKEKNYLVCDILLKNGDVVEVDFGGDEFEWKYTYFVCEVCERNFDTKKGFLQHAS